MLFWIIFAVILASAITLIVVGNESRKFNWLVPVGTGVTVIMTVILVITTIVNILQYSWYVDYKSQLLTMRNKQAIQLEQTQNVVNILQGEVGKYIKHEEDTYIKMTPTGVSILLVQYPQLQSVQTVTELMKQISQLNAQYYMMRTQEQDILTNIITYKNNVFYWFPVEVPVIDTARVN